MIQGDDGTNENLGIANLHLSEIKISGSKQQRQYFAEDLKKDKNYVTRTCVGKCKLISAFSNSNNTFIHYEAFFLEDFPESVDFGEKKKKSELLDKIPKELQPYFE